MHTLLSSTRFAVRHWVLPAVTAALCATSSSAWALDLTIEITGMVSTTGKVLGAVFNSQDQWLKQSVAQGVAQILPAEGGKPARAVLVFRNLPAGRYGVSVFHDENDNGKLDANSMGLPQEPLGFSRGARVVFGPPKFETAAMDLAADTTHAIVLR